MGFLHSHPKDWPQNRWKTREAMGQPIGLPDFPPDDFMVQAFHAAGPAVATAMGLEPLRWADVKAFADVSGAITTVAEYKTLIGMSAAYVRGLQAGANVLAIPPSEQERDE